MRRPSSPLFLALTLSCLVSSASAQVLDPDFGDGLAFTRLHARHASNQPTAIAQQTDGKLVAVMSTGNEGAEPSEIAVLRLGTDGARDTAFGEGGVGYFPAGDGGYALAVAIAADGKIVMAGAVDNTFAVFRMTADGRPDTTFGVRGTARGPDGMLATIRAMTLQADGAILVVGDTNALNPVGLVARFTSTGALDPAWDGDGVRLLSPQPWTRLYGIALVGGTPIIVGESAPNEASAHFLTLVRLDTTGAYDTSFDGDGIVFTTTAGTSSGGRSVALQTSTTSPTKLVVAGYVRQNQSGMDLLVVRYGLDGVADGTFGTGGALIKPIAPGAGNDEAILVRVLFSGATPNRIVVVGNTGTGPNGSNRPVVMKTFLAGTMDTAFDGDGVLLPVGSPATGDAKAALVAGGRVVIAGGEWVATGLDYDLVMSRHNTSNGSADVGFGQAGWLMLDAGRASAHAHATVRQADGRLLLAGEGLGQLMHPLVRRTLADGTPDSSFGDAGVQDSIFTTSSGGSAFGLAMQPDGKVLVVGSVPVANTTSMFIARLHSNGALDRGFGTNGLTTRALADSDTLHAVACRPDGRIVAVGVSRSYTLGSTLVVMQFLPDGTLDPNFGPNGDGIVRDGAGLFDAGARTLALQGDGRLLVLGRARQTVGGPFRLLVYRLLENGAQDPTWGGFGRLVVNFGTDGATPGALVLGSTGRVLVAGHTSASGATPFVLRYLASGVADSSFDGDGRVLLAPRGVGETCEGIAERANGSLVLAGLHQFDSMRRVQSLTRLTSTGALDATFGVAGRFDVPLVDTGSEWPCGIAFDPSGRAIVGGTSRDRMSLFRLQPEVLPLAVGPDAGAAATLRLSPPTPNPVREGATLRLALPQDGTLDVRVLDVSGRRVRTLAAGFASAGPRTLRWDGRDDGGRRVPNGIYFVQARTAHERASVRLVWAP